MTQNGRLISRHGLDQHGITDIAAAYWNYPVEALYEEALRRHEGQLAMGGALVTRTGTHTGRAPNDKFIIDEASSREDIWWGDVNKPILEERFESLRESMLSYLRGREVFVRDCYAGAHADYRLAVRVVTETAWHNLFARNMFIPAPASELIDFVP